MDGLRNKKILIVDDNEINRIILHDMLADTYELLEVCDGLGAVELLRERHDEIGLVLLDMVMPGLDGFGVLRAMNENHWIDDIQVIMISAESAPSFMNRAYDLGAVDFISRPFDQSIVKRRITNTFLLYAKQRQLMQMVVREIEEREKNAALMIAILSHLVEFRNGESGMHVLHINLITEMLLKRLLEKTDRYNYVSEDVKIIRMASSLHDIGKLEIPSEILNKPGRLTREEFLVMQTHTTIGSDIMDQLSSYKDEPLIKYSRQICRHHHERYDGRGYPDGLKGDEIPIAAQVVALADVYDALTSERCYKAAFSHDKAVDMIEKGECGVFNPLLLECFMDVAPQLREEMESDYVGTDEALKQKTMKTIMDQFYGKDAEA